MYDATVDPGLTVPVDKVFKSLRCELITFLEANRWRAIEFEKRKSRLGYDEARTRYAYLDLDPTKYGALQVDLKTIDVLGLTIGLDWKTNFDSRRSGK